MHREPTIVDALERTYGAGQSLVVRGVQLLLAETRLFLRDSRTFGIGVLVALAGWIFLMCGVIDGLAERYPRYAVELGVGLFHLAAGALLVFRARNLPPRPEVEG